MNNQINKPLPLKHLDNTRELGGYKTTDGKITKNNVFLRSGALDKVSKKEAQFFLEYGLNQVIDLRSNEEVDKKPITFCDDYDIAYLRIPLFENLNIFSNIDITAIELSEAYCEMLEMCKSQFSEIFTAFAENSSGVTLFNCTAGKDRAGMTAMLLLSLVGVDDDTIAEDYSVSQVYLEKEIKKQLKFVKLLKLAIPDSLLMSDKSNMIIAINCMKEKYGTAENYLLECGVTSEQISVIKSRFLN